MSALRLPPFDSMSADESTVQFICSLVAFLRPRVIVETGTYLGHTALAIAHTLRERSIEGHVYTADVVARRVPEIIAQNGLSSFITFTTEGADSMIEQLSVPIDFAWIDASGDDPRNADTPMRLRHLKLCLKHASPGALFCVDDTLAMDWPGAKWLRDNANLQLDHARGMSIFQVKR